MLVVGFTVLIRMFVWVASFMARPENTSTDAEVKEMDGQKRADETHLVKERGYGANYVLTLGVVSCVLFYVVFTALLGSGSSGYVPQRARRVPRPILLWRLGLAHSDRYGI